MTTPAKIPAKPGKDTVYIDVDDEITAIIDKVEGAKQKVVALVLPKRSTVLQSVVNMRLLKRNAEKAGKSVVLITAEEALLPLAGAVGLHVAKNLQSTPEVPIVPVGATAKGVAVKELPEDLNTAEDEEPSTKLDYHRTVGELATAKVADEPEEAIDLEDEDAAEEKPKKEAKAKTPKDKKLKVPNFDRFRLLVFGGAAALILLIVFIVLAIFVLPKATITITTESTPVSVNLTLNAADSVKTLDEAKDNIPAVVKTSQQTQTQSVPATGQQNNGAKATGSVTMTAQACAPDLGTPDSVPAGTGLSSGGLTFITQAKTTFSFGSASGSCVNYQATSSTAITGQTGGAKYNLPSGTTFSVSGRSDISSSGSTSGGTDNNITIVSQGDLDNAAAKLTSADTTTFTKNFESQLASQGLYVLISTLKPGTPAITANPAVGQQASNTTVTTTITYTVLSVQKSDLTKVLTDALNGQIDKGKQKLSATDVLKKAVVSVQSQGSPSTATLSASENTLAIPTINAASIKQQATGQKIGDIKSAINTLPGVKSVDVELSPFWVSKAPKASKITVKLVPASTSKSSGG